MTSRYTIVLTFFMLLLLASFANLQEPASAQGTLPNNGSVYIPLSIGPGQQTTGNNQQTDDTPAAPEDPSSDDPNTEEPVDGEPNTEAPVDGEPTDGEDAPVDDPATEDPAVNAPAVPDEYVIVWKSDVTSVRAAGAFTATVPPLNIDVINLSGMSRVGRSQTADEILESYHNNPAVAFIEPNYIYTATLVPNDPNQDDQWAWDIIEAYDAWDITLGSAEAVVAIIDTGVDLDHPDLADKIVTGFDFVQNDNTPDDGQGHGTHVAGSAAASTDNETGGAGVCPNCSIMPLRALDNNGSGTLADIANAITYATDNGADVINMSLGGRFGSQILEEAVNYAWQNGVFVTCAAGNSGASFREYPAGYDNCVAVAATNSNDQRASFSQYGSWVEVAAPGQSIFSTHLRGGYTTFSGTSMASPHVAGMAGLLSSQGLDNDQIRARICDTADDISGTGSRWSCGRINLLSAVSVDAPEPEPTSTPTPSPEPTPVPTSEPTTEPQPTEEPEPTDEPQPTPEPTATPTNTPPPTPTLEPTPEPTDEPQPTPEPTATTVPGDPPPANEQLLDGGFEDDTGWSYSAEEIRTTRRAYNGQYSARLGGEDNSTDAVEQTVIVPSGDSILSYVWRAEGYWDFGDKLIMEIELLDGSGATFVISHSAWRGFWYSRAYDMSSLAGIPIKIRYSADTNGRSPSSFYVDDVALE